MRISKLVLFVAVLGSSVLGQTAPYYTGVGCDESGTRCLFGTRSEQVLDWFEDGTSDYLGDQCQHFMTRIADKKKQLEARFGSDFVLRFKKFTLARMPQISGNAQAIRCSIEIHSENPQFLIQAKRVRSFNWVCADGDQRLQCRHQVSECVAAADGAREDQDVLTTAAWGGASLLQGQICTAVKAQIIMRDDSTKAP